MKNLKKNSWEYILYFRWQQRRNLFDSIIFLTSHFLASIIAVLAVRLRKTIPQTEKTEILFLYREKDSFLVTELPKLMNPYKVQSALHPNLKTILRERLLAPPQKKQFSIFYIYDCYAAFLIKMYNPKVIVTERNGSILSPFLKKQCAKNNIPIVHFAFSLTTDNYRNYSMIDYDYYFLYGRSSFDKISNREHKLGNCQAIITGSWQIQKRIHSHLNSVAPGEINENCLILVGSGPNYEKLESTKNFYKLLIDFTNKNDSYNLIFKPHPRSDLQLWANLTKNLPENKFSIANYLNLDLKNAKLGFCGYTNAILDLAKIGIIPILMADEKVPDLFDYELFFGKFASNSNELEEKINTTLDNYRLYDDQRRKFIEYHLSNVNNSEKEIKNNLTKLLKGKSPQGLNLN